MKISTYIAIAAGVLVLFGVEYLLVPQFALQQGGGPTGPYDVFQARLLGVALLGYGLILWLARGTRDDTVLRAFLLAGLVLNTLFVILCAWASLTGLINAMGWVLVAINAVFLPSGLYYLASSARRV